MSNEAEENRQAQELLEADARQSAVDTISGLYPPDSEYGDTRALGREDVIEALCFEWRSLPLAVLDHMAKRQHQRDHRI